MVGMPVAINSFQRWVVRKIITGVAGHELDAYVDGVYSVEDDTVTDPVSILRLQIRYEVTRTGLQKDTYENVLHFVNTAGELPGATASDAQKIAVEGAFDTFWGLWASSAPQEVALKEYRWYHFSFDDPLTGPPTRISTKTTPVAGSATNQPAQMATSVTMRTTLRRHWGRIYLPGATPGTSGFASTVNVDNPATRFRTFVNACDAIDLNPVVYSRLQAAVFSITAIEVDNVPDVIRRRRPKASTYKKILDTST